MRRGKRNTNYDDALSIRSSFRNILEVEEKKPKKSSFNNFETNIIEDKEEEFYEHNDDEYIKNWENISSKEGYLGSSVPTLDKSKYDNYLVYRDNKELNDVDEIKNGEGIHQYLARCGFDYYEGYSLDSTIETFKKLINDNKCKTFLEIGFNTGKTCLSFLECKSIEKGISFDICIHHYVSYGKHYIDKLYPNKHILIMGDSKLSVPSYESDEKFDFIYIDGDHRYESAYKDIENCMRFAHKNTILVIDDVCPHRGLGRNVYNAILEHCKIGNLIFDEHIMINKPGMPYSNGLGVFRYNFSDEAPIHSVDFKKIESFIPVYYYSRLIEESKSEFQMKTLLSIYENKGYPIDNYMKTIIQDLKDSDYKNKLIYKDPRFYLIKISETVYDYYKDNKLISTIKLLKDGEKNVIISRVPHIQVINILKRYLLNLFLRINIDKISDYSDLLLKLNTYGVEQITNKEKGLIYIEYKLNRL